MQLNEQKKEITNKEWEHWKKVIVKEFNQYGQAQYDKRWLDEIWNVATKVLLGLEVRVVVDGNNTLYSSHGTGVWLE